MRKLFPKILNSSPKSHKSKKLPKTVSTMTKDCQNLDFLEKESEGVQEVFPYLFWIVLFYYFFIRGLPLPLLDSRVCSSGRRGSSLGSSACLVRRTVQSSEVFYQYLVRLSLLIVLFPCTPCLFSMTFLTNILR